MTKSKIPFNREILHIEDIEFVCDQIVKTLKENVLKKLSRRGGVVGISGGIDSSLTLALTVKAFGPDRVLGIMLPEKDSSPESLHLAKELADKFKIKTVKEDITNALMGFGCYERRDNAVKNVFTEYDSSHHKFKIGINQDSLHTSLPPIFSVTIVDNNGSEESRLLPLNEYLQIVASSNFKQRTRMAMLYYHAERQHFAVIGTPNKHEVEQGFFVKYGDGGADVMPIAPFYKTQVYQLAKYLEIPKGIINRTPTTDTYTAEQTQEEFFFQLPFELMDLIWYGWENNYSPEEVAEVLDFKPEEIYNVYKNFDRKRKTTDYLRQPPIIDNYIL
jgi:NAD+ synthase